MATRSEAEAGEYEKCREERIKANRERMEKLGLLHLSRQVHHAAAAPNPKRRAVLVPIDQPSRRSNRLQNLPSVDYAEVIGRTGKNLPKPKLVIVSKEGTKEEFYTEEHDRLLGSCEEPWNPDICSKNDTRVYDQVSGKSCHQCRQKTTGYRTSCSKCKLVQGQLRGGCIYTRYGENVLEAIKNTEWICPVCRGICNCSNCRIKKGWNPTGLIYKKVASLGYKSVAHYLIQTRRKPAITEANKENEPNPNIIITETADESNAAGDEEMVSKCPPRFTREKKERSCDSVSRNYIAARLRRRHYRI